MPCRELSPAEMGLLRSLADGPRLLEELTPVELAAAATLERDGFVWRRAHSVEATGSGHFHAGNQRRGVLDG